MVGLKFFLPFLLGSAKVAFSIPVDLDANATASASPQSLISCLQAAGVPLIPPTSADYAPAVLAYNLRFIYRPAVVVVPTTSAHVSSAVKCAATSGVKVAARSGGHSYAAYGLGGQDGSMMIDMKKFRTLSVDSATKVATVGAGLRLGDVATGLYAQGGRALPHGSCPGVGVSGHALHGGFGFASRMWGLTVDNIVEVEVVKANGDIVIASKSTNSDLFWALRGAGSSFGIVTRFSLTTYPAPSNAIEFSWTWSLGTSSSDVTKKVKVFEALQTYSADSPSNFATAVYMEPSVFVVNGVYWGTRSAFNTEIASLKNKFPQDHLPTMKVTERGWIDSLVSQGGVGALPQPENYTAHDTFFAKSIVAPTKLTTKALTSFFSYRPKNTNGLSWFVLLDLYGGKNSKILAQNPADSSFFSHDAFFTLQLYAYTSQATFPSAGFDTMKQMSDSLTTAQPETTFKAYTNYVDPTLSPSQAHTLYYGSNYPKLASLKKTYDPNFLFWNPQAIGT